MVKRKTVNKFDFVMKSDVRYRLMEAMLPTIQSYVDLRSVAKTKDPNLTIALRDLERAGLVVCVLGGSRFWGLTDLGYKTIIEVKQSRDGNWSKLWKGYKMGSFKSKVKADG